FIGGTGNISSAVSTLAVSRGIDLYLLNRGQRGAGIPGAKSLVGNISNPHELASIVKDHSWDSVVDWIAFTEQDIQRDYDLFNGTTKQFVFISSASAYQRPASHYLVTESTPLSNPFWQYSRDKIACERKLNSYYRQDGFPITIVRPSLTYRTVIPIPIGAWTEYTAVDRIKKGKKIIVHGDGSSLWTITHADDFAKGFVGLLGNPKAIGEAFQITSDEVLTWDQIHYALADALGQRANIVHIASDFLAAFNEHLRGSLIGDKATSVVFNNTKIKTVVPNFICTIPFAQGIQRTIEWFEADPARQVIKQETNDWIDHVIARYEQAMAP
ncbi:MAG TPA: NAD-dependent epimerase/dehydratase family protein, partial [Bacteroidota bacterium]